MRNCSKCRTPWQAPLAVNRTAVSILQGPGGARDRLPYGMRLAVVVQFSTLTRGWRPQDAVPPGSPAFEAVPTSRCDAQFGRLTAVEPCPRLRRLDPGGRAN